MDTCENKQQFEVLQTLIIALGSGLAVYGATNLLNGIAENNSAACELAKNQIAAGAALAGLACRITPQGILCLPA